MGQRKPTSGLGGVGGGHGVGVGGERDTQCSGVPTGRGSGGVALSIAAAPPLDRTREGGGAVTMAVNLMSIALGPHLLL
jgi:hypothetical protein